MYSSQLKKSHQRINIVIPGLFEGIKRWPENRSDNDFAPALLWFLSKASKYCHSCNGFEQTLLQSFSSEFNGNEELPVAVLRSGTDKNAVICADPVSLQLGVSELALIHGRELELTAEEIEDLCHYINAFLEQENMHWKLDSNGYGCLQLASFPDLSTTALLAVSGEIFTGKLPQGRDQAKWHRLGNEIQMLLHDCALNKRRETEGKLPINALWFWGCGQKMPVFDTDIDYVYANDGFSEMLATQITAPLMAVPDSFLELDIQNREGGHSLIVLKDLWDLSQKDDYLGWRRQLEHYDKLWFQPLLKSLTRQPFASISFTTTTGELFVYRPNYRYRFWRKQRSLYQCHLA